MAADGTNPWFERALGAALYRAGRINESIVHLNKSVDLDGHGGHLSVWLFLAMAHSNAGHTNEAQVSFANGQKWLKDLIPDLDRVQSEEPDHDSQSGHPAVPATGGEMPAPLAWQDRAVLLHLFSEAKAVVGEMSH